jgi:hypothetical protein
MAGPWEQYQQAPAEAGPWAKYAQPEPAAVDPAAAQGPGVGEIARRGTALLTPAGAASALFTPEGRQDLKAAAVGTARGVKDIIDTGAELLSSGWDRMTGGDEAARVRAMNQAGKQEFQDEMGGNALARYARVGGNIAATYPVGGVLAAPARALGMNRLAMALATGGGSTGAAVAPTVAGRAADMGIRMAGGAATGYASAGLIDPEAANTGAVVGAALPPVASLAGKAGDALGSIVRPFTRRGQEKIAGNVLREFATNADDAAANLRAAQEVVPGSAPTTAMAAGDEGLAGLTRTMQSADPRFAAELSARQSAQNAARTSALEEIAGNTGKLQVARTARDEATDAMRETVLDAAGKFQARPVLDSIDRLLAKPDNAGKISQAALSEVRNRIAQFAPDGQIDARALYAIRKDINDTLGGKLQGEAGNLKLASGQLAEVKKVIDQAIDQASRRVEMSAGRALMPAGANIERAGMVAQGSSGPRPTWQGYLQKYRDMSIPINQMEELDEVLKAVSTGSVDKQGNAILSAAKLNNLLRNRGQDLQKVLSPEQLEVLRRLSADLNAGQLAATSGKAVGSNTVQNLSGVNAMNKLLGQAVGGSTPVQATLGRAVNWAYKKPDQMILERLGDALLDPQEAARLLSTPQGNAMLRALSGDAAQIPYRAAPALAAQR